MKHENLSSIRVEQVMAAPPASPRSHYEAWGKRALDLALSVVLLPVLAPVIAVLMLITQRDGASGLFGHQRIGQHGRSFKCYKIRTMVPNAEAKLEGYLSENKTARQEWQETQKLTNDPRITPLGRFLRKTSLDELPQIWNVIRGDMSFVGPRPVTRPELDRYGPHVDMYLKLKPGITGLWQVEGRSNGCYDERLKMDRTYSQDLGIAMDLKLILSTARVVLRPTGR